MPPCYLSTLRCNSSMHLSTSSWETYHKHVCTTTAGCTLLDCRPAEAAGRPSQCHPPAFSLPGAQSGRAADGCILEKQLANSQAC